MAADEAGGHGPDPDATGQTWFGFRPVAPEEKRTLVRGVFESVAGRYDLMNDLMSGGVHRLWKMTMMDWLAPRPGQRLLDVAGGTGDIAMRFLDRVGGPQRAAASGSAVTVCDLTPAMLAVGRDRAIDRGILSGIDWVAGDAQALPIADHCCDAYTIAFGLRNVADIDRALAEARRVLKPGGRFLCLEFSRVTVAPLARLYDIYSFAVVPLLGQVVVGDRASYDYLVESIRRFPAQEALAARIAAAGLSQVKVRNLSGGIAALHSAWRI
jgi:demethylmenaquinone methyltransferase/2-methoxy-6-polyprenyl-1,4-benzoquinol methylase